MDAHTRRDFAYAEHLTDLGKGQAVEMMKVDRLAVFEGQAEDGAQQLAVFRRWTTSSMGSTGSGFQNRILASSIRRRW